MTEDKHDILSILKESEGLTNTKSLMKAISVDLQKGMLTDSEKTLLNLVFIENPKQEDLDKCLENCDIEVVGGHRALLLAYFMKMHPELKYSDYVAPRLKGLLQYYRFQNLKLVTHYTKICRKLEKSNIDFLILKGGCMKYLRPDYPRVMGDIDILVHKKDYKKSGQITAEIGYNPYWHVHSIDVHQGDSEDGILDIHKFIPMLSSKEKNILKDIFNRSTRQKVFGVETLVPCNEDLFFIMLVNMVRNLWQNTSSEGILYNLFDCKFLIDSKPDFNWNIVIQNAKKTGTKSHIYFAIQFINSIVPNLLPKTFNIDDSFEKEFKKYCILLIYQRFFLWEMKQKGHPMKIKNLFSSKEFFKEYMKLKPKYFILKQAIIRRNPYIAKLILKKAYKDEN